MSSLFGLPNPWEIKFDPIEIIVTVKFDQSSPVVIPVTQADLDALEARIMSKLSDALAEAKTASDATDASIDAEIVRVQSAVATLTTQITDLDVKIADLQAQVDAGTATPADFQLLADLTVKQAAAKVKLDQVNPATASTLPPV